MTDVASNAAPATTQQTPQQPLVDAAASSLGKRDAPEDATKSLSFKEQHELKLKQAAEPKADEPEAKKAKMDDAATANTNLMAALGGEGITPEKIEQLLQAVGSKDTEELKSPALRSLLKELAKMSQEKKQLESVMGDLLKEKTEKMKQVWDQSIKNWVADLPTDDTAVKAQFEQGIQKLCDTSADKSGVWQVACCASELHRNQVNEIERLRQENNALVEQVKTGQGFANEEARLGRSSAAVPAIPGSTISYDASDPKMDTGRLHDFIDSTRESDVWGAFESFMRQNPAY